jgi:hypothetical protein
LFRDEYKDDNGVPIKTKIRTKTAILSKPLLYAWLRRMFLDVNREQEFAINVIPFLNDKQFNNFNLYTINALGDSVIDPYQINFSSRAQGSKFFFDIVSRSPNFNFMNLTLELSPTRYSEGVRRD